MRLHPATALLGDEADLAGTVAMVVMEVVEVMGGQVVVATAEDGSRCF